MNIIKTSLITTFIVLHSPSVYSDMPVNLQDIPAIMQAFEHADEYRKRTVTLGRLPHKTEIGQQFPTYVADGQGGYKLETTSIVTSEVIIARMPFVVAGNIFHEWLVPKSKWIKEYDGVPTDTTFTRFKRTKTIKAIKIDEKILTLLNSKDQQTAVIAVSWDPKGMIVYKEGYIADHEYGIGPDEMQKNYERVK
ncbi:hypothetical protein [Plesiomonas sp.]|uniref:hypothetical protein n=1 Tax=Plesiomonas sp. TaxID=2486279 RepID=UPI003F2A6E60